MTNLTEALFASLILHRRDRNSDRRDTMFADLSAGDEDYRAARERARKRS